MNILSIQSHVAYGHVGNAAAVFPLQRLGAEVWPINTVQFSNHTGYGAWRGDVFPARLIDDCVQGVAERGALGACDGILSGYVGAPETGDAILRAVKRVKAENPKALYCCDPVIGDVGRGVFVREGVPDFFRHHALGLADIVTPNHFELEFLVGSTITRTNELRQALAHLTAQGPRIALVTSLNLEDTPAEALDIAAFQRGEIWRLRTPRLQINVNGAGDCIAALFFFHILQTENVRIALEKAASAVFSVLQATQKSGARELQLIAAQGEIAAPSQNFTARLLTAP
jgi:pyridoxine kinase